MHTDTLALLLEICREAREAAPQQFLPRSLEQLRRLIHFDVACVCRCETTKDRLNIHSACLHGLPESFVHNYREIADFDPVAIQTTAMPGTVQSFSVTDARWQEQPRLSDYWQRHGLHTFHAVALPASYATSGSRQPQQAWLLLILGTRSGGQAETPAGAALLVCLLAHLAENQLFNHVWALHQAEHVDIDHHGLATALYCPENVGYSLICGPDFDVLLDAEFGCNLPAHGIRHLPAPLLTLAKAASQSPTDTTKKENPARHSGKQGVFTFYPQPAGHVLIHGRGKLPIDTLTKTELAIAELTAQGLTYKEIARERGISPNTVRNHLVNIRKKTVGFTIFYFFSAGRS